MELDQERKLLLWMDQSVEEREMSGRRKVTKNRNDIVVLLYVLVILVNYSATG